MPFKVPGQYEKALGSDVEVKFKGGKKLIATLTAYDGESITLRFNAKESVEGSKKKALVEHKDTFPLAEINSVMPHITFE
jgi:ribosome maturation factor RimP